MVLPRSGNPNPLAARRAKKAKRQHGDINALREVLWKFISRLEQHIAASPTIDPDVLKAGHAMIQAGGVFLKCIEVGELEARVAMLETQHQDIAA